MVLDFLSYEVNVSIFMKETVVFKLPCTIYSCMTLNLLPDLWGHLWLILKVDVLIGLSYESVLDTGTA